MRIPHSSSAEQRFSVSMTPMIDVVFLLLIFFVCTASFQISESLLPGPIASGNEEVQLPRKPEELDLEHVLIGFVQATHSTELSVNGQSCSSIHQLAEILSALVEFDSAIPVILDIDGATPLGFAIDVYDQCRWLGFENIQFAARHTL